MNKDRLSRKKSFVLNSEHSDMIVNGLLKDDFETLGRIFTDLVNYNLYGDESIVENAGDDKAEIMARRLLRSDSEHYISNWLARSEQNAKNRTSGQEPSNDELMDYARAKGYDTNIVKGWAIDQAHRSWTDQDGNPIKYWKKTLDAYMRGVNRKRIEDMTKTIGRR